MSAVGNLEQRTGVKTNQIKKTYSQCVSQRTVDFIDSSIDIVTCSCEL